MTQKLIQSEIKGIDRRLVNPDKFSAWDIRNLSYEPKSKTWSKSRGWIAYLNGTPDIQTEDCYSMGTFSTKGGAKNYILCERVNGTSLDLEYIDPRAPTGRTVIATGRHIPSQEDPGTQYIPFGNFMLIMNGYDEPVKYFGDRRIETFGFSRLPSQCTPFVPGDQDMGFVASQTYSAQAKVGTAIRSGITVVVDGGTLNSIGMGNIDVTKSNTYAYAYSWVTDTGSESPLSPLSVGAKWTSATAHAYRYGMVIDGIDKGPDGTVKRRLYRTKNIGNATTEAATLYFLDDIPNNAETSYTDFIPDSNLGSEAPSFQDVGLLPRGCAVGTNFNGRIVIGGGIQNPTRLFYSTALGPEQFPEANYIDCAQRDGDEITGLIPFNNLLIILRRGSIEALVPTTSGTVPFYVVPIYNGVGCIAPKTAKVITGVGLAFLGTDGFYLLKGNFSGGSQISVQIMSDQLSDYISRINVMASARAVATYNVKDNEYWCSVPVDGSQTPNLGFIFHAPIESWSIREGVPAQAFAQIPEGWTIFGSNGVLQGETYPVSWGIWCGINVAGYANEARTTFNDQPDALISSGWMDFGDADETKTIKSVIVHHTATSKTLSPTVTAYIDWDYEGIQSTNQIGTVIQDQKAQPFYDEAIFGVDKYSNMRLSATRADFSIPNCRYFRFQFSDSGERTSTAIVGFSVLYESNGVQNQWTGLLDKFTGDINRGVGTVPASFLPSTAGWK